MLSLPTELWLLIGAYLPKHDLYAAIQVNHTFHSQLIPILYRNFVICGGSIRALGPVPWPKDRGLNDTQHIERLFATIERLKRIECSSILMDAIKSCTLCHFDYQHNRHRENIASALKQVFQEAVAFISRLPQCCDIVVHVVHTSNRQLKQLVSHHSRPVKLSIRSPTILDGDSANPSDPQYQCSLKDLSICEVEGSEKNFRELVEWTMSRDLQSLSVKTIRSTHFPLVCNQLSQNSFPNLRRLEIIRDIISTQVLACLPMLEELFLSSTSPLIGLTPAVLPRLRSFRGSGDQARSIVPGRPIRVLYIEHFAGTLPAVGGMDPFTTPDFGSTTPILELTVREDIPSVVMLWRIAKICPLLQVLYLSFISFSTRIDAVSLRGTCEEASSPRRQSQFTTKYMPELYRLKHLQRLDFKYISHAPSKEALIWEHSMCEAFRTRSAPNIHHVSFNVLVEWNRVPCDRTWTPSCQGRELGKLYPCMIEAQWPEAPFPLNEQ